MQLVDKPVLRQEDALPQRDAITPRYLSIGGFREAREEKKAREAWVYVWVQVGPG